MFVQELQKERDLLAQDFQSLTRKWAESNDPALEIERNLLAKRLRVQYFLLDPYIRGRGCELPRFNVRSLLRPGAAYHRNGVIVGNGLVSFAYPGAHGLPTGEYEVLGYAGSKEALDIELNKRLGEETDASELRAGDAIELANGSTPPATPKKSNSDGAQSGDPRDIDGLPSTSSSLPSVPPSYASTPVPPGSAPSRSSVSDAHLGSKPFRYTVPLSAPGESPIQSQQETDTQASAASNLSTRSKLKRRFSSSMKLRNKGDKRTVNQRDGSVQA